LKKIKEFLYSALDIYAKIGRQDRGRILIQKTGLK